MWDERYQDPEYAYGTEPNDFLAAQVGRLPAGGRVLCLADGEGRNSVWLAEQGFQATSVDASLVGVEKALRLAAGRGVELTAVCADLADYPIAPGSWDAIVSIFCHLPGPTRASLHRRSVEGLRPGGVFLLEAYTAAQLAFRTGGPPTAEKMMDLATLRTELKGLDLTVAQEVERVVHEGRYHHGRSAVVQVVGVKGTEGGG